jgi:hypothetical protein
MLNFIVLEGAKQQQFDVIGSAGLVQRILGIRTAA